MHKLCCIRAQTNSHPADKKSVRLLFLVNETVIHCLCFEERHEPSHPAELPQIQSSPLGWQPGRREALPPAPVQQVKTVQWEVLASH